MCDQSLDGIFLSDHGLHGGNGLQQLLHELGGLGDAVFAPHKGHTAANHIEGGQLHGIGFRAGYGDFRACMGIERVITLPCDGGPLYIDDG